MYRKLTLRELTQLVNSKTPTPVNVILDRETIEFLLSLNSNNRNLNPTRVRALASEIDRIGWKSSETLCVSEEAELGNGQHRLYALRSLGYPDGIKTTIVFGVDWETVLTIDQHGRRSSSASVKIATGKKHDNTALATIRCDINCNTRPNRMTIGSDPVSPSQIVAAMAAWQRYFEEMPQLLQSRKVGAVVTRMTAPMILAVVHYRRRAGVEKANDFIAGFWGDKEVTSASPELKAMNFRATFRAHSGDRSQTYQYRVFVYFLLAHFEGRKNPSTKEAMDWGRLRNANAEAEGKSND